MKPLCEYEDEVAFVLEFKLWRFGGNAVDVLVTLQTIQDFGVNCICVEDGIDSSTEALFCFKISKSVKTCRSAR